MEYAAEYFTGEICDGLSIIGLLCIIPFPMGEEVGVQSWRFLTQRRRGAEYAEGSVVRSQGSGVGEWNGSLSTKFGEYVLDNIAITHQLKTIFRI